MIKKRRIYDIAKEQNLSSKAMVDFIRGLGHQVKSHSSTVGPEIYEEVKKKLSSKKEEVKKGLEQKKKKEEARKQKELDEKQKKTSAKRKILAQLTTTTKKKGTKKTDLTQPASRRKKDRRRRKERVVDKKAVKASFKQTMSSLSVTKRKKHHHHDKTDALTEVELTKTIKVSEFITVSELATIMELKPTQVVAKCMELGMMATVNQRLDLDTISTIALEFGFNVEEDVLYGEEETVVVDEEEKAVERPPVVTIMGHVDHGKTSLLDYIRKSHIIEGESGGITQHIGAYVVDRPDGKITFLDTPGHEAFSSMRARGAQITDIVILVVAADDAVMPQTIEAIDHARAANVPIVVAINKIDLPGINIDNIKQQLAKHNLVSEEWGGKTIMVEISAKFGTNIDKLLEMVLLQAEMMDIKANPERKASGVVIEARLDRGKGVVATILVQKGVLSISNPFVAGVYNGKVRALLDEKGKAVKEVTPSIPIMVLGCHGVPQAGDAFFVANSESDAKNISQKRLRLKRERDFRLINRIKLTDVFDRIKEGKIRDLNLIIKGDVDGSVEALSDTLSKIVHEEVAVKVIHRGVGAINESDVMLAAASQAIIVGFHTRPDIKASELALREHVDIKLYKIIYEVESDIKKALEGLLRPEIIERKIGRAEVRQLIKIPKIGIIAGSYVKEGIIRRGANCKVIRNDVLVGKTTINSLKRFKDDVREVQTGYECGIGISGLSDVETGDIIEVFEIEEIARTLDSHKV
ncbi:MAG: translation initiation factor IF-2 [candidate division Zixibacteria bacterium]|nr:translation initiation factor IF-2 [candidate division Zixibacteria bacterium]